MLLPILSLVALKKGYVVVHGSALLYDGVGVVLAGHATSGKTTTLLGFGTLGAEFVGDDWLLLRSDGQKMHGLPAAIDISPKHAESSRLVRHPLTPWRPQGVRRPRCRCGIGGRGRWSRLAGEIRQVPSGEL